MVKTYKRSTDPDVAKNFHVFPFPSTLTISARRVRCLECENVIRRGHFAGVFQCKHCVYKTHCEEAAKIHCKATTEQEYLYFTSGISGPQTGMLPRTCNAMQLHIPNLEENHVAEEGRQENPVVEEGRHSENPVVEEGRYSENPVVEEGRHSENPVGEEGRYSENPVVEEGRHSENPVAEEERHSGNPCQICVRSMGELMQMAFDEESDDELAAEVQGIFEHVATLSYPE